MEKSWNVMEFGFENCVGTLFIVIERLCLIPVALKRLWFGTGKQVMSRCRAAR